MFPIFQNIYVYINIYSFANYFKAVLLPQFIELLLFSL